MTTEQAPLLTKPLTLLAIFAHPDDESFGPGATLAKYAQAGVRVYYLCGTRGEMGTVNAEILQGYADLAEMRWNELTRAANELGLTGIYHLGYRDSGMMGSEANQHPQALMIQPVEIVARRIAHFIRKLKPQVVLTHDTIGGYRHPDHIMLNKATMMFFERMYDAAFFPDPDGLPDHYPQKLYYPVIDRRFLKMMTRLLPLIGRDPRRFGRNQDIDLLNLTNVDFPVHAVINTQGEPQAAKTRAIQCHRSQLENGPPRSGFIGGLLRLMSQNEKFTRAYPVVLESNAFKETNLFEAIS
jgi:LmbE family N-acetylglucosaminyl deacetylase